MEVLVDLHTHTNVSNHAFSSMGEMIQRAKDCGMKAIAITNHGPAMEDAPHRWYYSNFVQLPSVLEDGFVLIKGAEANIVDTNGDIDLEERILNGLDWVTASLHFSCIAPHEATETWLKLSENPLVDMIGHAEQAVFMFDYDRVTKAFTRNNKVVEMNQGSYLSRPGNEENLRQLAIYCKNNMTKIAITSDAHSIYDIGKYERVFKMLESIGFPEEQIINTSYVRLAEELKLHGKQIHRRIGLLGAP